jgi:uncharacterized phage protein (TIGR02218 family)
MKTIGTALQAHLDGELTTLAALVKITRVDGMVLGFTTHDLDLVAGGVTYKADGSFSPAVLKNAAALKASSYEITGILDSALVNEANLKAGLYDHARIDVYMCNWADLSQGVVQIRRGWLGEINLIDGKYVAALRGLHDLLGRRVGDVYTAECRYQFCDQNCGKSLSSYTFTGSVSGVTDLADFTDTARTEASGIFNYGILTWTSGANNGLSMEVANWDLPSFTFSLWLPMPNAIAVGDSYSVTQGCDKKFSTCCNNFSNAANFGGFPHLPGLSVILQYPDSQ